MTDHPTPRRLADFALGKLPDPDARAVADHLGDCDTCRHALDAQPDDSFVRALHDASPAAPTLCDTTADLAVDLLRSPRYRVLEKLGEGGMGTVYKAEQLSLRRIVALKVLRPELLDHPNAVSRFRQEVKAAGRLAHPNIVTAYDAEQAGNSHFLVMEFIDGYSFDKLVAKTGPLPIKDACELIRQAAVGLQHAHEHGMVHRDVKPHNLMLTRQGLVKILDFGLAQLPRDLRTWQRRTAVNAFLGTPEFVSPEQATDAASADIRADVYSLGCTLYYLLAGRPPFHGATALDTALAHIHDEPPPLPGLRSEVSAELWAVVARMLAKDRNDRHSTPAEVAESLLPFTAPARKDVSPPPLPARLPPTSARPSSPRRLLAWVIAAWVVAGVLLAAFLHSRTPPEPDETPPEAPDSTRVENPTLNPAPTPAPEAVPPAVPAPQKDTAQAPQKKRPEPPPPGPLPPVLTDFEGPVNHVMFLPDGRLLTSEGGRGGSSPVVKLRSLLTDLRPQSYSPHERVVGDVALSPKGNWFGTVGADKSEKSVSFRLASTASPQKLVNHYPLVSGSFRIRFTPDEKRVMLLHRGQEHLTVLEVPSLRRAWEQSPRDRKVNHSKRLPAIDITRDGKLVLMAALGGNLRVWDADSGKDIQFIRKAHAAPIRAAQFSPDARLAFTAGDDTIVRIWDWRNGLARPGLIGHTSSVQRLAVSPDGKRLLSGDTSGKVILWNVALGKEIDRWHHKDPILSLAFSPDGKQAASGSADKTVHLKTLQ